MARMFKANFEYRQVAKCNVLIQGGDQEKAMERAKAIGPGNIALCWEAPTIEFVLLSLEELSEMEVQALVARAAKEEEKEKKEKGG